MEMSHDQNSNTPARQCSIKRNPAHDTEMSPEMQEPRRGFFDCEYQLAFCLFF